MSTVASIIRYVDTNSRQSCYLVFITLILRDDGVDLVEMIKKNEELVRTNGVTDASGNPSEALVLDMSCT